MKINYIIYAIGLHMTIELQNAGKKFNRDWIFRHINFCFKAGSSTAITGPNGSGKSTLLQAIALAIRVNEGKCLWFQDNGKLIQEDEANRYLSIVAPYLEVIEEMTATEFLQFHAQFKPLLPQLTIAEILEHIGLSGAAHKQIRYYSSGMVQRIKLAQAIFSNTPVLLLDEPCTNLDAEGYTLYHHLIENYTINKTIIVSSNDIAEMDFCQQKISIIDFK